MNRCPACAEPIVPPNLVCVHCMAHPMTLLGYPPEWPMEWDDPMYAEWMKELRAETPQWPACMTWPLPESGVHPDDWQAGRGCGICGRRTDDDVLDHDHDTGLCRGWLCRRCNTLEGKTGTAAIIRWRSGYNPYALLDVRELYVGWGVAQKPLPPSAAEMRAAIDSLPRLGA